jgi:hypothetical protein
MNTFFVAVFLAVYIQANLEDDIVKEALKTVSLIFYFTFLFINLSQACKHTLKGGE